MLRNSIEEILKDLSSLVGVTEKIANEEDAIDKFKEVLEAIRELIRLTSKGKKISEIILTPIPEESAETEMKETGCLDVFLRLFNSSKSKPNPNPKTVELRAKAPEASPEETLIKFSEMQTASENKSNEAKKSKDPHCVNEEMMFLLIRACACTYRLYDYLKYLETKQVENEEDEEEALLSKLQLFKEAREEAGSSKRNFEKHLMKFYCLTPRHVQIDFEKYYQRYCSMNKELKKAIVVGVFTDSDLDQIFHEHRVGERASFYPGQTMS